MKYIQFSDKGPRMNNEDCLNIVEIEDKRTLFVVCDGMGGHEHGEVASQTVSQAIGDWYKSKATHPLNKPQIEDAITYAYAKLDEKDGGEFRKMGTTLTLLYIGNNGVTAAHMGDSRIYHIRPGVGVLYQSRDHSLVFDLFQAGEITYEEMATYPQKNMVTRAMTPGEDNRMRLDIIHITDIQPNDYFYMCSDGMLEQMSNDQLVAVLSSETTDKDKQDQLIEATSNNQDNHTAWIIHIKSVVKEEKDWEIPNEELTAKCNMALNYPSMENKNSDVTIVKKSAYSPLGFIKRIFNV
mgnify:CR=1 FL=1